MAEEEGTGGLGGSAAAAAEEEQQQLQQPLQQPPLESDGGDDAAATGVDAGGAAAADGEAAGVSAASGDGVGEDDAMETEGQEQGEGREEEAAEEGIEGVGKEEGGEEGDGEGGGEEQHGEDGQAVGEEGRALEGKEEQEDGKAVGEEGRALEGKEEQDVEMQDAETGEEGKLGEGGIQTEEEGAGVTGEGGSEGESKGQGMEEEKAAGGEGRKETEGSERVEEGKMEQGEVKEGVKNGEDGKDENARGEDVLGGEREIVEGVHGGIERERGDEDDGKKAAGSDGAETEVKVEGGDEGLREEAKENAKENERAGEKVVTEAAEEAEGKPERGAEEGEGKVEGEKLRNDEEGGEGVKESRPGPEKHKDGKVEGQGGETAEAQEGKEEETLGVDGDEDPEEEEEVEDEDEDEEPFDENEFSVGQTFESMQALRDRVMSHCARANVPARVLKWEATRLAVQCAHVERHGCQFFLQGRCAKKGGEASIVKFTAGHNCKQASSEGGVAEEEDAASKEESKGMKTRKRQEEEEKQKKKQKGGVGAHLEEAEKDGGRDKETAELKEAEEKGRRRGRRKVAAAKHVASEGTEGEAEKVKGEGGEDNCREAWQRVVVPLLYDWFANHHLMWPSLSCRWGPVLEDRKHKYKQRLYLCEQTDGSLPNTLVVVHADIVKRRVAAARDICEFKYDRLSPFVKRYKKIVHPGEVNRIRELAQNANVVLTHTDSPEVYVWDVERQPNCALPGPDGKPTLPHAPPVAAPDLVLVGHTANAEFALATSRTAPHALSGGRDKTVLLWSLEDHVAAAVSEQAGQSASAGAQERPAAVTAAAGTRVSPRGAFAGHTATVEDVQFHPAEPSRFCSVGDDARLLFWDARTHTPPPSSATSEAAAPSEPKGAGGRPQGPVLAVDAAAHSGSDIHCVDWNVADANLIVTGAADGRVRVFDVRKLAGGGVCGGSGEDAAGVALAEAAAPVHSLQGHQGPVMCVQWCPDRASAFASAGDDGLVNVWDCGLLGEAAGEEHGASTGLMFQHCGHQNGVMEFQWSPVEPWTFASVSSSSSSSSLGDDALNSGSTGGGCLQLWRVMDLVYRPRSDALKDLGRFLHASKSPSLVAPLSARASHAAIAAGAGRRR